MQSINQPQAAILAGMQQGGNLSQYQQGQLAFADGGLASLDRTPYFLGGIGRKIKKLVPKELAGIMQVAAPFVAPQSMLGAAALSGLGQYKSRGKISPFQLAMSVAPGITRGNISSMTGGRYGKAGSSDNFIRNLMQRSNVGSGVDKYLFGSPEKFAMGNEADGMLSIADATGGLFGEGGNYGGLGELVKKGGEAILTKPGNFEGAPRQLDKMALAALGLAGMSYIEAKKQMQLSGEDLADYGIESADDWEQIDWSETFKDSSYLPDSFAKGGRAGYAMGTSQFPMTSTREGLAWGSDKGEGLGGMEVEADMRYEGGFMPYGEKPKADDVPARLSKNEFVFTDEAVAGMGGGDVNVGAERLYNMMKQLEEQGAPGEMGIGAMA